VPVVQAYADTFATKSGQMVLEDLERSFGGSCYTKGDPHDTAFREGSREVLMRIKQLVSYSGLEVEDDEEKEEVWP
jgi:hypothetical protein